VGEFLGQYRHTIDDKGRLTLPARFRDGLGAEFYATKGFERCLFLYPAAEWEAFGARLRALPLSNEDARRLMRAFFSGATDCRVDAQGRVLLPAVLRDYAGLQREAVVVGAGSRAEVWEPEAWQRYEASSNESLAAIAERLAIPGF
jgi:MraZ protein